MSATMLETFDTQMHDFVPSPSAWYQDDEAMEDDSNHPLQKLVTPHDSTSVEVEMDAYDDGNNTAEYEMTDDHPMEDGEGEELVDIEVLDAPVPDVPSDNTFVEHSEPQPSYVADATTKVTLIEPHSQSTVIVEESFTQQQFEEPGSSATVPAHAQELVQQNLLAPFPPSHKLDTSIPKLESFSTAEELSQPEISNLQTEHVPHSDALNESLHASKEQPDVHPSEARDEPSHVEEYLPATVDPENPVDSSAYVTEHVADAAHETENLEEEHDSSSHVDLPSVEEDEGFSTNDPLEISDGVFIDPPPGVLLSVTALSNSSQFSLFNQPDTNVPGPSSVTVDAQGQDQQTLTVLLAQQPTLYYEPLSTVFDALRQDEALAGYTDMEKGELVLDAHDLRLVISEDNIYSREVTLHDLNILHDGSGFSGPLRLELRVVSSRFILQYRSLQDQIFRLDIAEGQDGQEPEVVHEGEQGEHQVETKDVGEYSQDNQDSHEEVALHEQPEQLLEEPQEEDVDAEHDPLNRDGDVHEDGHADAELEQEHHEEELTQGDIGSADSSVVHAEEVTETAVDGLDDSSEEQEAGTDTIVSEHQEPATLDADEVHHHGNEDEAEDLDASVVEVAADLGADVDDFAEGSATAEDVQNAEYEVHLEPQDDDEGVEEEHQDLTEDPLVDPTVVDDNLDAEDAYDVNALNAPEENESTSEAVVLAPITENESGEADALETSLVDDAVEHHGEDGLLENEATQSTVHADPGQLSTQTDLSLAFEEVTDPSVNLPGDSHKSSLESFTTTDKQLTYDEPSELVVEHELDETVFEDQDADELDADATWEADFEHEGGNETEHGNDTSSATLSSGVTSLSKRSFDEFDDDSDEEKPGAEANSPGKRIRVE